MPDGRMPWQDVDRPASSDLDSSERSPATDAASRDRIAPTSSRQDAGPGSGASASDRPLKTEDEVASDATSAARRQLLEETSHEDGSDQGDFDSAASSRTLTSLWPIPALVVSCVLIGLGLYLTFVYEPPASISQVLSQASSELDNGHLEQTATLLRDSIEPRLEDASVIERATYYMLVGDLLVAWRSEYDNEDVTYARKICDTYTRARDVGGLLDHQQVEALALAHLEVSNHRAARDELSVLSARATHPEYGGLVRPGMNRVLKEVVQSELALHHDDPLKSIKLIHEFINDSSIPIDESTQAWLIMRGAELQLGQGQGQEVITQLLVLMRRSESWAAGVPQETLAEMSLILGEAYSFTGDPDRARHHLGRAQEQADQGSLLRGRALVGLGDLALSEGKVDTAIAMFDEVILDYPQTDSRVDALLGRAAGSSIQGDHQSSLQDYQEACGSIERITTEDEQRLERIADALADRHDASIVQRDLALALDYISLAEGFFPRDEPPVSVLVRLASTSRQLADDLSLQTDLDTNIEAHRLYRQSGDTHLRVAQALEPISNQDDQFASHLRLASEAFDRGAWRQETIEVCQTYLASLPTSDPSAPDLRRRLATNHEAQLDYEQAAVTYQEVIDLHPSSPAATASYVPLARCLRELSRSSEAKQLLIAVTSGDRGLAPAAVDFRDATMMLGELEYDAARWSRSIEFLTQAVVRYPLDPRRSEVLFRIGDCYRQLAAEQSQQLDQPMRLSPKEQKSIQDQRDQYLRSSMSTFSQIMSPRGKTLVSDEAWSDEDRLARLYYADCAFELGAYDKAITEYESVARRYPEHHSSVYALVQIVNAYTNLQSTSQASAAHRRALIRLSQMPDSAFAEPDALMDRRAWERWIESSPVSTTVQVGTEP